MKTSLKAFVLILLVCFFPLASAGSMEIEVDSGLIGGSAEAEPLGEIVALLTQKMGFAVYLDTALAETPVSFKIKKKLLPEKAIQRMVRPHSYAMVFSTENKDNEVRILELWIFREGQQHSASYIPFKKEDTHSEVSDSFGGRDSGPTAALSAWTPLDRGKERKALVRPDLHVEKSVFGTPVVRGQDRNKGPDYRLSAYEMHQAHEMFRLAKHREERRMAEITMQQARTDFKRNREAYISKRNQELKNQIQQLKQK